MNEEPMQVLVPFDAVEPKTRLSPVLDSSERWAFSRAMLADVVSAIRRTGHEPTVCSTGPFGETRVDGGSPEVVVDERSLTGAVNDVLEAADGTPVAVVMADLALATPAALESLFAAAGDVAIAPGRGGGTNALVVRHPGFRVDYHGTSYVDHRRAADALDATTRTVDSYRLGTDIDEPDDLIEVLLHGGERSRTFLERAGFRPRTTDGRVVVERSATSDCR